MSYIFFGKKEENINGIDQQNEITTEMVQKAGNCRTADELVELAKSEGFEITKEEAEGYLAELEDVELDEDALEAAAGGSELCYKFFSPCVVV